jgi:hypothetical protein
MFDRLVPLALLGESPTQAFMGIGKVGFRWSFLVFPRISQPIFALMKVTANP